jgi:transposase-like protein
MKKTIVLLLVLVLASFAIVSCVSDTVSYCPFCGSSNIKEVSDYNTITGITTVSYECQNSDCGKKFGAGQVPAFVLGGQK